MKKEDIRVGQSVTSGRQALQPLDESSPCLRHAAARGPRYRVIHGHVVIDSIPTPPPPPPGQRVNREEWGDL
jgi:hypothetical protein